MARIISRIYSGYNKSYTQEIILYYLNIKRDNMIASYVSMAYFGNFLSGWLSSIQHQLLWDMRSQVFSQRVINDWNKLASNIVTALSLSIYKDCY